MDVNICYSLFFAVLGVIGFLTWLVLPTPIRVGDTCLVWYDLQLRHAKVTARQGWFVEVEMWIHLTDTVKTVVVVPRNLVFPKNSK